LHNQLYNAIYIISQPEYQVTDQNQALPAEGSDAHQQGEQSTNNNNQTMESLLQEQDLNVDLPQSGEIRPGIIASISPSQILVSIGAKSEGVVSGRELEQLTAEERDELKVGQEVHVYVINPEDANGNVVLSLKRAQEQIAWDNVERLVSSDEVVESKVMGFNKGGLIVGVEGLRGFVPSSQISAMRRSQSTGDTPEQRWQKMIGQPITVRVIEVDRERRRLILSERAASTESRQSIKERVIEELEEGKVYTGRVTSLANFGAFININGADGLVHLSELSWDHIDHPREVLEVGQEIKVKVINVDREKKRIGLSVRALQEDPWRSRVEKYSVGQLVEGVITRLTKFGAFARLEGDIEGLIHISEIADHRIEHPKEVLKEGEVKSLRVIRIDPDQHRIGLSLRKVDSAAFADKDFKLLAAEYNADEEPEVSESSESPERLEPSEPSEDSPGEAPSENSEA
jgi:small subunit ribosomal protein S1